MADGPMTIGGRLRQMYELAGYEQRELAQALGISQPGFAAYVGDRVRLPADKLALLAEKLELTMDGLYFGLGIRHTDRGEQDFGRWWNDLLERRYTLQARGFGTRLYTEVRTRLLDDANAHKRRDSDHPSNLNTGKVLQTA